LALVKAPLALLLATLPLAADTKLPDIEIGRFADVPPRIATPVPAGIKSERPSLDQAANAKQLLGHLGIQLTDPQRRQLDRELFVLINFDGTKLATEYAPPPKPDDNDGEPYDYRSTTDEMLTAFARVGSEWGEISDRNAGQAKLVTPDLFLHAWHRYFSNALEHIEQTQLRPRLEQFLALSLASVQDLRADAPEDCHAGLYRLEAQLGCAWVLLGLPEKSSKPAQDGIPEDVQEHLDRALPKTDPRPLTARLDDLCKELPDPLAAAVRAEIALILAAKATEPSPLFSVYGPPPSRADYTQFIPRSHYTKNEKLSAWFRAMMFLGRNGLNLKNEDKPGLSDSLLLLQVLAHQPKGEKQAPLTNWKAIMEITSFFAGPSDDLDYPTLRNWVAAHLNRDTLTLADATNPQTIDTLRKAMPDLRPAAIVSSIHDTENSPAADPPSFRVFGQRFTFDSWVLSELTRGSPNAAPTMPAATFVAAAFGDPLASRLAEQYVRGNPTHEETLALRLGRLEERLNDVNDSAWFASMAAKQLHVMTRLAGDTSPGDPHYMRGPAYSARKLESMLGSWTELKHDTVLYAKQSYAEAGDGGPPPKLPPLPLAFVEPQLRFWSELERLSRFAADGFSRHKLLPDADEEWSRLKRFTSHVELCRSAANRIAAGQPLSKEQNEKLWLLNLLYMDEPLVANGIPDPNRGMTALVTDVHTDAGSGKVLLEALDKPSLMLALVSAGGSTRLTAGVAYRHLEFTASMDKRMTDETWRKNVYSPAPDLPPRADWTVPVFKASALPPKSE